MTKFFNWLTSSLAWLQIVASPFLAGIVVGWIIDENGDEPLGLILAVAVSLAGLVAGILLARRVAKRGER